MKLEKFLKEGIIKSLQDDKSLGDRSTYIGSSDIGGCLRKSYLDKTSSTFSKELKEEQALIFMRGHVAEMILQKALNSKGIRYKYQLEVSSKELPIKTHPDFVVTSKSDVVVIECKSTSNLPDTPYASWVMQIQLQMHILKEHFNKAPRGYIVALELNSGQLKEYQVEYQKELAEIAIDRAKTLWNALQNNEEPEAEEQLYCSKCPHRGNCPIFQAEEITSQEVVSSIEELKKLEDEKKELDKKIKSLKADLEAYFAEKGIKKAKVGEILATLTSSSSFKSLDTTKLKKEAPELYQELLEKFGKEIVRKASLKIK